MTNESIIKATDDYGVEYYTERTTGASGMSQLGLARLTDKGETTIRDLVRSVRGLSGPKSLEHWHNEELTVRDTAGGSLQNAVILKAEFCFDVVAHYADKGNETARNNERILGRAGATLYCQRMTGWFSHIQEKPHQPQLPTPEERLKMAVDALANLGVDTQNPRFQQGYQDWAHNLLGIKEQQQPESKDGERWLGVAERAEELDYGKVGADHKQRTALGTYVGKANLERVREERLCNGQMRKVWVYKVTPEFDNTIHEFFQEEEQQ
jgi:hypothetical protein